MSKIEVSVIIPTYHRNDLLAKCLDCLTPGIQTLLPEQYEVIVTDDGSISTAEEMIREHYHWVIWVRGPRKGPAANRNNGFRYAQGEWLAFTDDDCLPSPTWLTAFSSAIFQDLYVYEGKTTCEAGIHSPLEYAPINLTGGYLWSCNMLINAKVFEELGKFDESFPYPHMEDVELRDRIEAAGYSFPFVENAVVDHPPKILPWGDKLVAMHETDVFYWHQKKKRYFSKRIFMMLIIKERVRAILHHSFKSNFITSIADLLKAVTSLMSELFYTLLSLNKWYEKYPYKP